MTGERFSQQIYRELHRKERKTPPRNLEISPRMEKSRDKPVCYIDPERSIVVEIKAMDIDRGYNNQNSCGYDGKTAYSMRVSYIQRLRDDKTPQHASETSLVETLYKKGLQKE